MEKNFCFGAKRFFAKYISTKVGGLSLFSFRKLNFLIAMRKDRCAANLTGNFWLILIFGFALVARFLGGAAGVFCRMQNAERAIWLAVSV